MIVPADLRSQGVNLPGTTLALSPLTEGCADLAFGALDLGVDWVAFSFVPKPADVIEPRPDRRPRPRSEKPQALELSTLSSACDAISARGVSASGNREDVPAARELVRAPAVVTYRHPVIVAREYARQHGLLADDPRRGLRRRHRDLRRAARSRQIGDRRTYIRSRRWR